MTRLTSALSWVALTLLSTLALPAQPDNELPLDPAITYGKLENGLTYYIRENQEPKNRANFRLVVNADSVALDPHKWLYSPIEAGCTLVKNPQDLLDTFAFHPDYYQFDLEGDQPPTNYYELGLQNTRGFRALKVWLAFKQVGGPAFVEMIRQDIQLAQAVKEAISQEKELEALTCHLSITTFRYVPKDLEHTKDEQLSYLNELNEKLLNQLQEEGEVFVSNAVLQGTYALRACIVNFRTTLNKIEKFPGIVIRIGQGLDAKMRV